MTLEWSCFISYAAGHGDLTVRFMNELTRALSSSLEPLLPRQLRVYRDEQRIRPGYRYNPALARALCRSVCMVLVYTRSYELSDFCLREFAAMKTLERLRFERMNVRNPEMGLIIPVVFRGRDSDLPSHIKDHVHYSDFRRFTTADTAISRNRRYMEQIEHIAEYVSELYAILEQADPDAHPECEDFELPDENVRELWGIPSPPPPMGFPR